jgi:hypothetical protein
LVWQSFSDLEMCWNGSSADLEVQHQT